MNVNLLSLKMLICYSHSVNFTFPQRHVQYAINKVKCLLQIKFRELANLFFAVGGHGVVVKELCSVVFMLCIAYYI